MDAVATYRLQKKANDFTKESMCIWDCNAGYYKAEGDVAACVRCVNKPLDAGYTQVSNASSCTGDHAQERRGSVREVRQQAPRRRVHPGEQRIIMHRRSCTGKMCDLMCDL
jgi:hypothetical protein